jgi:hypothetical protein
MSASPVRTRRSAIEGYKPKMISTIGAKPACLVNASVTYVGDDQIYAFGGFDQYTDEGTWIVVACSRHGKNRIRDRQGLPSIIWPTIPSRALASTMCYVHPLRCNFIWGL